MRRSGIQQQKRQERFSPGAALQILARTSAHVTGQYGQTTMGTCFCKPKHFRRCWPCASPRPHQPTEDSLSFCPEGRKGTSVCFKWPDDSGSPLDVGRPLRNPSGPLSAHDRPGHNLEATDHGPPKSRSGRLRNRYIDMTKVPNGDAASSRGIPANRAQTGRLLASKGPIRQVLSTARKCAGNRAYYISST